MQHSRTRTFGGGDEDLPSISDLDQVRQAGLYELAAALIRAAYADAPAESVNRRSILREVAGELGRAERASLMRKLAEAWQVLEHTCHVCVDPEETRSDWWFLTVAGGTLLTTSAPVATLKHAHGFGR